MVGLSRIITAIAKGAKAVYNLGKKLGGLIVPLLSVVSNISLGAKGIGCLLMINMC